MNQRAHLTGRSCTGLLAREFWRGDRLVEAFCVVFIRDDQGSTWHVSFDDEDSTWKLKRTDETPHAGFVEGDRDNRWPIVDLQDLFPVKGELIQGFTINHADTTSEALLEFSSGRALRFSYAHATEETSLTFDEGKLAQK